MDLVFTKLLQALLLGSTATLAGLHLSLSLTTTPALLAASNPLPSFVRIVYPTFLTTISSLLTGTITGLFLYFRLLDGHYLVSAGLCVAVLLYTVIVMFPLNNQLFALNKNLEEDAEEAKWILEEFARRQRARIALTVAAFAVTVVAVLRK